MIMITYTLTVHINTLKKVPTFITQLILVTKILLYIAFGFNQKSEKIQQLYVETCLTRYFPFQLTLGTKFTYRKTELNLMSQLKGYLIHISKLLSVHCQFVWLNTLQNSIYWKVQGYWESVIKSSAYLFSYIF